MKYTLFELCHILRYDMTYLTWNRKLILFDGLFVTGDEVKTCSSAVAERPRDASCLAVVSFNSTIRRAQSSIIGYFGFRFTAAYN